MSRVLKTKSCANQWEEALSTVNIEAELQTQGGARRVISSRRGPLRKGPKVSAKLSDSLGQAMGRNLEHRKTEVVVISVGKKP